MQLRSYTMMELIDYVIEPTNEYMESMSKDVRKKYGQFFTAKKLLYLWHHFLIYHHFVSQFLF